jgi:XTP/dITP diphosphohydrolase
VIPPRLVLATVNPGKVTELRELLSRWKPVEVLSLEAFPGVTLPPESDTSYVENAIVKARAVAVATGLPALGDDSGLEVERLGGGPGVRSARWAASDPDRIRKLLDALADAPPGARCASFRCVVALVWPEGRTETAEGVCAGAIALSPSGGGGFGYDPVFVPDELECTFADASREEKQRLSHRARAIRALGERLALRAPGGPC